MNTVGMNEDLIRRYVKYQEEQEKQVPSRARTLGKEPPGLPLLESLLDSSTFGGGRLIWYER